MSKVRLRVFVQQLLRKFTLSALPYIYFAAEHFRGALGQASQDIREQFEQPTSGQRLGKQAP